MAEKADDPRYPFTNYLRPLAARIARQYRAMLAQVERAKGEKRAALEAKLTNLREKLYAAPNEEGPELKPEDVPVPPVIFARPRIGKPMPRPEPSGPARGIVVFEGGAEVDVYGRMPTDSGDLFQGKLRNVEASHVRWYQFNAAKMVARPHYG